MVLLLENWKLSPPSTSGNSISAGFSLSRGLRSFCKICSESFRILRRMLGHCPRWLSDKESASMQETQETQFRPLGQEDPLEKGVATHSNILVWRILWTEEPGGLQTMGSQRAGYNWSNRACPLTENSVDCFLLYYYVYISLLFFPHVTVAW